MHPRRAVGGLVLLALAALCAVFAVRGGAASRTADDRFSRAAVAFQSQASDAADPASVLEETDAALEPPFDLPPAPAAVLVLPAPAAASRQQSPRRSGSRAPPDAA